jgi:hypothetical protein
MVKEELIKKYCEYKDKIDELEMKKRNTIAELAKMAEHKVGEIVQWTETERRKNVGTTWRPQYVDLPDIVHKAVVTWVNVHISSIYNSVDFTYEFRRIKNDGSISQTNCYPRRDIVWTGEIHEDYKDK